MNKNNKILIGIKNKDRYSDSGPLDHPLVNTPLQILIADHLFFLSIELSKMQ